MCPSMTQQRPGKVQQVPAAVGPRMACSLGVSTMRLPQRDAVLVYLQGTLTAGSGRRVCRCAPAGQRPPNRFIAAWECLRLAVARLALTQFTDKLTSLASLQHRLECRQAPENLPALGIRDGVTRTSMSRLSSTHASAHVTVQSSTKQLVRKPKKPCSTGARTITLNLFVACQTAPTADPRAWQRPTG